MWRNDRGCGVARIPLLCCSLAINSCRVTLEAPAKLLPGKTIVLSRVTRPVHGALRGAGWALAATNLSMAGSNTDSVLPTCSQLVPSQANVSLSGGGLTRPAGKAVALPVLRSY